MSRGSDSIPKRFKQATIASWAEKAKATGTIPKVLTHYVEHLDEYYDKGQGLLLLGPGGRGKSYVAAAVLNAAVPKYRVRFIPLARLIRLAQSRFEASGKDFDAYELVNNELIGLRNVIDFLVIDDVGKEYRSSSGYAQSEFDYTLRYRYDEGLPTIMTSNLSIDEWTEVYGEPMASFVHEACVMVALDERFPDLRKNAYAKR
jgi:DNA replication protein DnaC